MELSYYTSRCLIVPIFKNLELSYWLCLMGWFMSPLLCSFCSGMEALKSFGLGAGWVRVTFVFRSFYFCFHLHSPFTVYDLALLLLMYVVPEPSWCTYGAPWFQVLSIWVHNASFCYYPTSMLSFYKKIAKGVPHPMKTIRKSFLDI